MNIKILMSIFTLIFICNAGMSVDKLIQKQEKIKNEGVKGLIIQQKVLEGPQEKIELVHPDELFKEETAESAAEERRAVRPRPAPTAPGPIASNLTANTVSNSNYVTLENYYEKMLQLNERLTKIENNIEKVAEAANGIQDMSVKNREFFLRCIEIFVAFLGISGIGGTIFKIKSRKKGG